jgi:hypothetical protein
MDGMSGIELLTGSISKRRHAHCVDVRPIQNYRAFASRFGWPR